EISLMHVRMKKAVPHRMHEEGLDDEAAKPGHVMACRNECIAVRSGNAVDPFHRYDAPRCPLPVDARHAETPIGNDILRHLRHGSGFKPKVHLKLHAFGKRLDALDRAKALSRRIAPLDLFSREEEALKVECETLLDARS